MPSAKKKISNFRSEQNERKFWEEGLDRFHRLEIRPEARVPNTES